MRCVPPALGRARAELATGDPDRPHRIGGLIAGREGLEEPDGTAVHFFDQNENNFFAADR